LDNGLPDILCGDLDLQSNSKPDFDWWDRQAESVTIQASVAAVLVC
jgi:hypothetical protein